MTNRNGIGNASLIPSKEPVIRDEVCLSTAFVNVPGSGLVTGEHFDKPTPRTGERFDKQAPKTGETFDKPTPRTGEIVDKQTPTTGNR